MPVYSLLGCLLLISTQALSQHVHEYPKGYFMFPIMPGQTNYLSGNMGELRPNHFHGGLDIKTQGREGLPVYASAEGYVSRIKVTTGGYGNALYITHPNGYMTVYGHLKTYNKAIGDYLRQQQYAKKSFEIDLLPARDMLRINKGDVVAYSGNTGGSGGPHLHYEIRDTMDHMLNPLYFGFKEIKDHIAPVPTKLAIRTLDIDSRVSDGFGRMEFTVPPSKSNAYTLSKPVPVYGQIGLEILAHDVSDGTSNKNGVTCMEVKVDGKDVYSHHLEKISFDVNRHINVHIDYEHAYYANARFQKLYIADGNKLGIYTADADKGKITIYDDKTHQVEIKLWDAHHNASRLTFQLKGTKPVLEDYAIKPSALPAAITPTIFENTLKIAVKNLTNTDPCAVFYTKGVAKQLAAAYADNNQLVYLWDLRKGLPDSVMAHGASQPFNFKKVVPALASTIFEEDSLSIAFSEKSLFDTLYLETSRKENVFTIGKSSVPLQESVDVRLTPPAVDPEYRIRTAVYFGRGKNLSYRGGTWVNNQLSFKTRDFGSFTFATDTVPPIVKLNTKTPNKITCKITDNLSGLYSFKATLNGEWLLMQYDYKLNLLWSDPLDPKQDLKGDFVLEVVDFAGNATTFTTTL